jgi:hypothetical protein
MRSSVDGLKDIPAFREGDAAFFRNGLIVGKIYGHVHFTPSLNNLKGVPLTVTRIAWDGTSYSYGVSTPEGEMGFFPENAFRKTQASRNVERITVAQALHAFSVTNTTPIFGTFISNRFTDGRAEFLGADPFGAICIAFGGHTSVSFLKKFIVKFYDVKYIKGFTLGYDTGHSREVGNSERMMVGFRDGAEVRRAVEGRHWPW